MFGPRHFLFVALLACAAALSGCFPAAYIYPRFERFAVENVNAEGDTVTPFLVTTTYRGYMGRFKSGTPDEMQIRKLSTHDESLAADRGFSHTEVSTEAFVGYISVLQQGWSLSQSNVLRLYRPGYRLEEVPAGTPFGKILWTPAENALEEERALDQLVSASNSPITLDTRHNIDPNQRWFVFGLNVPKPESTDDTRQYKRGLTADRDVLRFVAAEYDRIAAKSTHAPSSEDKPGNEIQTVSYEELAKPGPVKEQQSVSRLRAKAKLLRQFGGR